MMIASSPPPLRWNLPGARSWLLPVALSVLLGGCERYQVAEQAGSASVSATSSAAGSGAHREPDAQHLHRAGSWGGVLSSLDQDQYHVEAVVEASGLLSVFVLGSDETRLQEVPDQVLTAYVKSPGLEASTAIVLQPDPLPGDASGMTTRFSGNLPQRLRSRAMYVVMPGLQIDTERFAVRFFLPESEPPPMPSPVSDNEAKELYLTAGGAYTEQDVIANGRTTAAQKYQGFRAAHDPNPEPGARVCPISDTKAHPQCQWIIAGETYYFCCPPCIDEFLVLAKESPEQILAADRYRK